MVHIVTVDGKGMVEEIQTLSGDKANCANAEQVFLEVVEQRVSNFDEYTAADKEAICDNGYERYGNGSIQIHWSVD